MKSSSLLMAAALAMSGPWAAAQTQGAATAPDAAASTAAMPSATMPAAPVAAPVTPVTPAAPAPIVVETMVDLTTEPSPPDDPQAARQEAVNALHWARTEGCRDDPSPRECLNQAREDYREAMERIGGRR